MLCLFILQILILLWDNRCNSEHHQPLQEVLESIEERLDTVADSLKILDSFESKLDNRLDDIADKIESKLDASIKQVMWKLDTLHAKIERVDKRLDNLDAKLDRTDLRLNRSESAIQQVAVKLDGVAGKLEDRDGKIETLGHDLQGWMESSLEQVSRRMDGVEKWPDASASRRVEVSFHHISRRMDAIESKLDADLTGAPIRLMTRQLEGLDAKLKNLLNRSEVALNEMVIDSGVETSLQQVAKRLTSLEAQVSQSGRRMDALDSKLELGLNRSEVQGRKTAAAAQALWLAADEVRGCQRQPQRRPSTQVARKLEELGAALESSFASLLVAQNAFIDSCRREDPIPLLFEMLRSHAQQVGRQVRRHAMRLERLLAPPATAGTKRDDESYDFETEPVLEEYEEYQDGDGADNT